MKIFHSILVSFCGSILLLCLQGCNSNTFNFISKKSAWELYSDKLTNSGLNETTAGREWFKVAEAALNSPPQAPLPSYIKGVFKSREIRALAWQFDAARGTSIQVEFDLEPVGHSRVFIDVFQVLPNKKRLASFTSSDSLAKIEFKKAGTYILRIQPELMAEGNFQLVVKQVPTYAVFPVYGKDERAIQSFWGAPRGGGSRKHEGIDIFAERGTPVVAPVKGRVVAVRNRGLGGKQVWLRDGERGQSLYFAHLDSQAVSFGTVVKPGDTLGFVGNTGNAIYTPPHLHFGMYSGGAFDPYPFVKNRFEEPAASPLNMDHGILLVNGSKANFRSGPATRYTILGDFEKGTPVFVLSVVENWYLVESPVGQRGYIHQSLLGPPQKTAITTDSAYAFPHPFHPDGDSLLISTGGFKSIGKFKKLTLITDTLRNVYYVNN